MSIMIRLRCLAGTKTVMVDQYPSLKTTVNVVISMKRQGALKIVLRKFTSFFNSVVARIDQLLINGEHLLFKGC